MPYNCNAGIGKKDMGRTRTCRNRGYQYIGERKNTWEEQEHVGTGDINT